MNLLLDTCTLIWLAAEPNRLSARVREVMDDRHVELWLSDACVWEICLKWETGKLTLPRPPRFWIGAQQQHWHWQSLSIKQTHLFRMTELPRHHRDPFDRLLVAQAVEEGWTIVTPDPVIHGYPVDVLW